MSVVVQFPKHQARASATGSGVSATRACMEASVSRVMPSSPLLSAERTTAIQCSDGILSRCGHLRTAAIDTPISPAKVSKDGFGQSASSCLDVIMPDVLGHGVQEVKGNLSNDTLSLVGDSPAMADRMTESEEKAAFIGRVRAARMARFEKQKDICLLLGIDQGTWKQYETRTPLPWKYIPKFRAATGVSYDWLLTGEGDGPKTVPMPIRRRRSEKKSDARRTQAA